MPPERFPVALSGRTRTSASRWHRCVQHLCHRIYYSNVRLLGRENLPAKPGPVLYVGLHRNGAVDGFIYGSLLPAPVFMISTQLRESLFARLFFSGIEVVRNQDTGDRQTNDQALRACIDHLIAGGELFVMPEGTSSLGPHHLPFKSGAAWLLNQYLSIGTAPPITVIPLGIHYECAWSFRSRVEVVVGLPISTAFDPGISPRSRFRELRTRMTDALESVGVNVPTTHRQNLIERTAQVAQLRSGRSYFRTLKALESDVPPAIERAWRELDGECALDSLWLYHGVPLFLQGPVILHAIGLILTGPIVLGGIVLNLPPFCAAWWAGRRLPDDRNVIALWRLLVGMPLFAGWITVAVASAIRTGHGVLLVAYAMITVAAFVLYDMAKRLALTVYNSFRGPRARRRLLTLFETIRSTPADEAV